MVGDNLLKERFHLTFVWLQQIVEHGKPQFQVARTTTCPHPPCRRRPNLCLSLLQLMCHFQFRLASFPVFVAADDFAAFGAVVVADDAVFGHVVDHAGGAAVADAHCSLQ